jgi:hypothetical protein
MSTSKILLLVCLIGAGIWAYQTRIYLPAEKRIAYEIKESAQYTEGYDPRWDSLVLELAKGYIDGLVRRERQHEIFRKAWEAKRQGCVDPFIRYLCLMDLHQSGAANRPDEALARESVAIVDALHRAPYPAILRAYAAHRAFTLWHCAMGDREPETSDRIGSFLWHGSLQALHDRSVSELMAAPLAKLFQDAYTKKGPTRDKAHTSIVRALHEHFGDCATIPYLRGSLAVTRAWEARGTGWASSVTQEGWDIFHKELQNAQRELTDAWRISAKDPEIAAEMITVCMGLCLPRDEMERWFSRAIQTGLDASSATSAKRYYLDPRWHGSGEEDLAFARECLTHPEYGSYAVRELCAVHENRQKFGKLPLSYFAQPEVWADIKTSLSAHQRNNPHLLGTRIRYAYHAWLAKDWAVLVEQLPETLPATFDPTYIVSPEVYSQMLADARAHRPTTSPRSP